MAKEKILIIDDEPLNRFILNRLLDRSGFEIIEAEDGQQALDVLYAQPDIRIVLLDLNMPVLDGYGFLNEFNNNTENAAREIYIIVISASSESAFIRGAEMMDLDTSRVVGYMSKPVRIEELTQMISNLV